MTVPGSRDLLVGAGAGVLCLVGFAAHLLLPATPDVSWLLVAAERMLDGAVLGRDVVEINPPLIMWLNMPAVLLARARHVDAAMVWHCMVAAGILLTALWTARLLTRTGDLLEERARVVASVVALALVLIPRYDYAQREHVALVLALPFIALQVTRAAGGRGAGPLEAAAVGVLAAVGFSLKPYFLAVPLALLVLAWRRDRRLVPVGGEWAALCVTGLCYGGLLLAFAGPWLTYAVANARWYARYLSDPVWFTAIAGERVAFAWLFLASWLALRPADGRWRAAVDTVAVAAAAFLASAVLQRKGWQYHFVPAITLGALLHLLLVAAAGGRRLRPIRVAYWVIGLAAVAFLEGKSLYDGGNALAGRGVWRPDLPEELPVVVRQLMARGRGQKVAVLSSNIASAFPLVPEAGAVSVLRGSALWQLQLDAVSRVGPTYARHCRPQSQRTAFGQQFARELAEDLLRGRPDVLLVLRTDPRERYWGGAKRIEYLGCLQAMPELGGLLDEYSPGPTIGAYDLLYRR